MGFIASALSIITTLLSFWIDRQSNDAIEFDTAQYYLSMRRKTANSASPSSPSGGASTIGLEMSAKSASDLTQLSSKQKRCILKHRGRRLALSRSLSALWETEPKCIEIGSTVLTKSGATTHIVHNVALPDPDFSATAYLRQRYGSADMASEVTRALCAHFH